MGKLIDVPALTRFLSKINERILTTKAQVISNTDTKKFAGATAVKEIYNGLGDQIVITVTGSTCKIERKS